MKPTSKFIGFHASITTFQIFFFIFETRVMIVIYFYYDEKNSLNLFFRKKIIRKIVNE
jgi:hypothetical protein